MKETDVVSAAEVAGLLQPEVAHMAAELAALRQTNAQLLEELQYTKQSEQSMADQYMEFYNKFNVACSHLALKHSELLMARRDLINEGRRVKALEAARTVLMAEMQGCHILLKPAFGDSPAPDSLVDMVMHVMNAAEKAIPFADNYDPRLEVEKFYSLDNDTAIQMAVGSSKEDVSYAEPRIPE